MHDFLKQIADGNGWGFHYGRQDYQNLNDDIPEGVVQMYVDPIQTDSSFTDVGNEMLSYSGKLMLLLSSDVDEDYQQKYINYIKPLFEDTRNLFIGAFACSDYEINSFKTVEIINLFDSNLDGLMITYSVTRID